MEPKRTWRCEIECIRCISSIRIYDVVPVAGADCAIATILVSAAKLMDSSVFRSMVSYHSFTLTNDCLTIRIEDHTNYQEQNAKKIAKYLERVWKALMSSYGCLLKY